MLAVSCPSCRTYHWFPWRWDWGRSPDVVSHQVAPCRADARPVWIGLNPLLQPATDETHAHARVEYLNWQESWQRRKAERSQEVRQEPEESPSALATPGIPAVARIAPTLSFFQPPAGLKPSAPTLTRETTEVRQLETRSQ